MMVTTFPPRVVPDDGETLVTVGRAVVVVGVGVAVVVVAVVVVTAAATGPATGLVAVPV
jgi:hypothetical protein